MPLTRALLVCYAADLNDRKKLLGLMIEKEYQFNTLRHGRYSTMMMLYYLLDHKQLEPVTKRAPLAQRLAVPVMSGPNHMLDSAVSRGYAPMAMVSEEIIMGDPVGVQNAIGTDWAM